MEREYDLEDRNFSGKTTINYESMTSNRVEYVVICSNLSGV